MTFDAQFKKALEQLPPKEKDKLILRLLKNDLVLANRLLFELVDTDSVEDKRQELQSYIQNRVVFISKNFTSMGYLLMYVREISGVINEHISITKDKYGDITLTCELLYQVIILNKHRFGKQSYKESYTMCIYIIAKIFKVLVFIQKQHEDLHVEFKEMIVKIGTLISDIDYLMRTAINNGLDVNYLTLFRIPSNVEGLVKNLRVKGFLK
ncbi:MAG: hypothetical protein H7101_04990 [Deinococcales bacterium]|nr:hypothetical protein [Chitinophagaceae bacterium]